MGRAQSIAADSEILDDSYEEWKTDANQAIDEIRANGFTVIKVSIIMSDLVG